jgi:hypothetical protein
MTEGPTPNLTAAATFTAMCMAVLLYVLIASPGSRGSSQSRAPAPAKAEAVIQEAPGSVEERNTQRLADLQAIALALTEYARANNQTYPSTRGQVQTLCTYERLDTGCTLKKYLDPVPRDPAGGNLGYFYVSDGRSFIVAARWEADSDPPDGFMCPSFFQQTQEGAMVCVAGG